MLLQFIFISEVTNVQKTTRGITKQQIARAHTHPHSDTPARGCVSVPGVLADRKVMKIHAHHLLLLPAGTSIQTALNQITFQHIFYHFL
jgi:hypothetical protein